LATVKPFKAITPKPELVSKITCLPFDVWQRNEAKKIANGNSYSFLHVIRSEIDLPDSMSEYDEKVYLKAKENLDKFMTEGVFVESNTPVYYIYRQVRNNHIQTGLVACTSIDEYLDETIKKHEFTRVVKEKDRIKHFEKCGAQTEPIFLTYRKNEALTTLLNDWAERHNPLYHFISEDNNEHIIWKIDELNTIKRIELLFKTIQFLYIADGHHRSASAVKVGLKKRAMNSKHTGEEAYNFFMSVLFPDNELCIMDYNRYVNTLNALEVEQFISKVSEKFYVEKKLSKKDFKPSSKASFGMYVDACWYEIKAKVGTYDPSDPYGRLDVTILQENLLAPILGIDDPRNNEDIEFIGGIRGLMPLKNRVNLNGGVAFSMYPTTMAELISIADSGKVMPPKSTWFEPKLRSGLFIHKY